ncbi:MAG: haloalkane dehalogenase [Acidimicrobiia bacterium]|nr:haloalkane dehalogenase [Acidimicrobiia bacterium]
MTDVLRTPDDAFEDLPDFPFTPRWFDWNGIRLHHVVEGDGPPVVLFHGEPTWSFLYRKVAAELLDAGYSVIAADSPGFGRSDKPTDPDFYTYDRHTDALASLLDHLGVTGAVAVVQDWGGPIGLRIAVERPGVFDRLVVMNTGIATGAPVTPGFAAWRQFVEETPDLPIGRILRGAAATDWPDEVLAAYEAPFPTPDHKVGAHRFPLIVPLAEGDPGMAAMRRVMAALEAWERPTQVLFGTLDPIFPVRVGERWAERIPGATGLETVEGAGHFLQEDRGHEVGRAIAAFLDRT